MSSVKDVNQLSFGTMLPPTAELLQLNCTQFPSQGIFVGKKSWKTKELRSSTCALTGFFWLLSHVIYLKLTTD